LTAEPVESGTAWFTERFDAIVANIERIIQGKHDEIRLVVQTLMAGGHALIEDVPGVGKTLLAKSLARSIDCSFHRIQFTPDLLPSDLTGVSVWDRERGKFVFRRGPVFSNIVLGDEINRASPKTQAALLEAMEERQVTVDGITRPLEPPFMVIATQNPIEHEGTYPLPESQLDRFLMRISVGYPDHDAEAEMLDRHADHNLLADLTPVVGQAEIQAMIAGVKAVHVAPELKRYLIDLADASRRHPQLTLGMSPRATLNLQQVARAQAAARGRTYVTPDDIKALAEPVLAHRLLVTPEAQLKGLSSVDALTDVLRTVPVPTATTS